MGAASTDEERALVAAAIGLARLTEDDAPTAVSCLEAARKTLPSSAVIARDLALAYAHAGRLDDALDEADSAIALGDADAEVTELRAILLAQLERPLEAADAARESNSWKNDLIAAALGDGAAAYRVSELAGEPTARGALTSLVLAAHAGERGEETTARLLADDAEALAQRAGEKELHAAAHALGEQLEAHRRPVFAARLRATIDHATNPLFAAEPTNLQNTGVFLSLTGEGALHAPIGAARLDTALRVDQHFFLTRREAFSTLDLFGVTLAASVELPISRHPSAALIGLRARFTDTFGDDFHLHYATTIEGGPNVVLPMSSALRLDIGFYGISTDFIDLSPPDAKISSLNRDLVGQRAVFGLAFATEWLDGRVEAMFLRDDALGEAFDALGGGASARVRAFPSPGVVLSTGIALTGRDYGPVGDKAIIGPASTRAELRTAVELGARIDVAGSLAMVLEDVWVQNSARRLHAYTENILAIGLEQTW